MKELEFVDHIAAYRIIDRHQINKMANTTFQKTLVTTIVGTKS